jgi:peptidyl-prolyl cis-trans isomerase SurA
MKKYILIGLLTLSLNAKTVDKVVASVEGEPITSYELQTFSKQNHLSEDKALKILIQQKLIDSEIKKRGISVDDFEIEEEMEKIAKRNGMDLFQFKNILMQRGELKKLKNQIRNNLLKRKLFNQIIQTKLKITPEDLKEYYNKHKDEFSVFKSIQVIKYTSNNPEILKKIKNNPLMNSSVVSSKTLILNSDDMPLGMVFLFKNLKEGEYSPVFNEGMNYSMYYVVKKKGKKTLPFNKVKNLIYSKLAQQKQDIILKTYFDRLKNRADIEIFN